MIIHDHSGYLENTGLLIEQSDWLILVIGLNLVIPEKRLNFTHFINNSCRVYN